MYTAPQFYSVLWKCLFDIEYSILQTFIYWTSTMAYLFWYIYIRNIYNYLFMSCLAFFSFFSILFFSYSLYVCILLECCTYCIYWTLWSVTSSYCKWELMFYCFTVPTWNKVFLLLLLLLLLCLSDDLAPGGISSWWLMDNALYHRMAYDSTISYRDNNGMNPMSSGRLSSWRYLIRITYGICSISSGWHTMLP